jgi:hypothetical protein
MSGAAAIIAGGTVFLGLLVVAAVAVHLRLQGVTR